MDQEVMFMAGIQERAANASSLLAVVATAAGTGECYCEDIGNACVVLCEYIDGTTDMINERVEERLMQKTGGDSDGKGKNIPDGSGCCGGLRNGSERCGEDHQGSE